MIIFTSICANYLHKARTLAESVKNNIKDARFVVCLVEEDIKYSYKSDYFDDLILAKDAWDGKFYNYIFKHKIVEAATSVKAQFFKYLFNRYSNEDQFVYLDPDIYVYSDLTELKDALEKKSIILCPHLLQPGNLEMELSSINHGVFNLGFLGLKKSKEARKFLEWWAERLFLYCYDDKKNGIFTDQKWVDLAPCFFDVEIFKHNGYDFAPWSLLNSGMIEKDGKVYIKGDPLRFIHFSGFGPVAENCIKKWLPEGYHPFKRLYEEYKIIHDANDTDLVSKTPWSYGYYNHGKPIADFVREIYRQDNLMVKYIDSPFEKSNTAFQFIFLKRNLKNLLFDNKYLNLYKRDGLSGIKRKIINKYISK